MYTLKVTTVLLMLSGAVSAAFDNNCAAECQNSTRDTFKTLKCNSADDAACICRSPDFINGVQDCMTKRGCAFDAGALPGFLKGYCGNNPLPGAAAPSSKPPAPATSAPASSAPAPASTSAAPASVSTTSSVQPSQTAQTTLQTSASTVSQQASATSDAAAETSSAAAAPDAAPSGISHAASVGIGVGIAAAVVGAAIVGFCVYKNRKKTQKKPRQSMEISKPLPGSGRTYPDNHNDRDSLDKYDIEMSSNRYEDMAQGQQPRTMV